MLSIVPYSFRSVKLAMLRFLSTRLNVVRMRENGVKHGWRFASE